MTPYSQTLWSEALSDDLYGTLLRWTNGRGVAKMHGTTITLKTPPDLGGGPVFEVRYAPDAGMRQVQRTEFGQVVSMDQYEVAKADELLRALTSTETLYDLHPLCNGHDPDCDADRLRD